MNINVRSIILIVIALVVAGIAAFLARSLVTTDDNQQIAILQQEEVNIQILVVNKELNTGTFLKAEDLNWQSWPDDNVNENYIQKISETQGEGQILALVGSVAKTPISAGEPILIGRVVKPGDRGFMAAVLNPGYRAVSISISPKTGLSGFIFPGDKVDILLTHTVTQTSEVRGVAASQIQATETVLTDIRVLAIDTQMSNETNTPAIGKIATFEVSPKQAEKIALMSRMGELSLTLRSLANADEVIDKKAPGVASNVTFANEVSKVVAGQSGPGSAGVKKQTVSILRAGNVEALTFTSSKGVKGLADIPNTIMPLAIIH